MEKYYFKEKKYTYIFMILANTIFPSFWIIFDIIFIIKVKFLSIYGPMIPILFTLLIIYDRYIRDNIIKYIKIIYNDKEKGYVNKNV